MSDSPGGTSSGYRVVPFSGSRRMVAANSAVAKESHTIHLIIEADVTHPRELIAKHRSRTGEALSLTAYVVKCVGRTLTEFPELNAVRKGRQLFLLDDVTISVAVERQVDGESVPEPVAIRAVDRMSYREVNDQVRAAQHRVPEAKVPAKGTDWNRLIPEFALRAVTRLAYREVGVWMQYGAVGVTAVGMFGSGPMWLIPLSSSTIMVAVGSIAERPVLIDGVLHAREHLCLTLSFNHDIVDGAPATRFASRLAEVLASGDDLRDALE